MNAESFFRHIGGKSLPDVLPETCLRVPLVSDVRTMKQRGW